MLTFPTFNCHPLSFIGGSWCPYLSYFYLFKDLTLGMTLLNLSHLKGLTEMIINWIPWKSFMIICFRVMVVVLVKLVMEECQVPLQVSWFSPLSFLHYLEVCLPYPSTSSYPIRSSYWGWRILPKTLCLPSHASYIPFFSLLPTIALHWVFSHFLMGSLHE